MAKKDSVDTDDGRLSAGLGASLDPLLQDALDHPVRREVLRTLSQSGRARDLVEIGAQLQGFTLSQLSYHLHVLRRSGAVASETAGIVAQGRARYASEVSGDGKVRVVLRATEGPDRQRREAAAAASASPLLTMFRVPRPVRTIRLRARSEADSERDR